MKKKPVTMTDNINISIAANMPVYDDRYYQYLNVQQRICTFTFENTINISMAA